MVLSINCVPVTFHNPQKRLSTLELLSTKEIVPVKDVSEITVLCSLDLNV